MLDWRRLLLIGVAAVAPAVSSAQTTKVPGTLTVAFAAEAFSLDPSNGAGVDQYYLGQFYEQLIRPDPNLKRINWLAESWELKSDNDKPYLDIVLRKGVKFHTGDELSSRDFEFAFNRLRDSKISRQAHLHVNVEKFDVIDDHHFQIRFKEGDGSYIADNLQLWALSKAYHEKVGEEAFLRNPVGTGPWKFVSRTVKDEMRLEAFDEYWNQVHRPSVKNLVIKVIPEDLTRVAAFKTGAVDLIDAVPPSMIEEFKKLPGVKTASFVTPNNLYIAMDTISEKSPFRDLRVRQALAHAVDVDAIIRSVLFGQGERYAQVGRGSIGYDPELKPYPYDPAMARRLLRAAGYPNGVDIPCYNLITQREPYMKEMGEAMFAYATASGIRCKVQGLEYGAWLLRGRRSVEQPPMAGLFSTMWPHGAPGDPGTAWTGHVHSYVAGGGYGSASFDADPDLDRLVEELKRTMEASKRDELVRTIARLRHERLIGGLPTYRPISTFAWRDNVTFTGWPMPGYWHSMQEIGLKK